MSFGVTVFPNNEGEQHLPLTKADRKRLAGEADPAGKPVVVTQSGGPNEYVTHEHDGLKIHPRPDSVTWGLVRIFSDFDHARWMGANGRRTVEQRFTWDMIADQVIPVYGAGAAASAAQAATPAANADKLAMLRDDQQSSSAAHVWARLWVEPAEPADDPGPAILACCRAVTRSGLRPQRRGQAVVVEGDAGAVTEAVRACFQAVGRVGRLRVSILPVLPREAQPLRLVTMPTLVAQPLKVRRPPGQPSYLTIMPRRFS
jgi:hypothetical protein